MSTTIQDLLAQARGELRHQSIERRVRASLGGDTVVDTTRALLVWEPRRVVPTYAVPIEDIGAALAPAPAAANGEAPGVLHPGIPFAVHTASGEPFSIGDREGAAYRFLDEDLAGYVALDFAAFDAWYEEDEQVVVHPRDPFHRVDVRRTSRPVRIAIDGEVIAETERARLLFETSLPVRFYVPREDVLVELQPSSRRTYCPYKGEASYWSLDAGGRLRKDIGWTYEQPLPDGPPVAGLVAFWDERVDVLFDGQRRERPGGAIASALRDEFSV
jgi:uncharacterized protein (DUF427 family)